MGHEKGKKFFSSYEGDQIDALLGAMAQANPMPSGTDWVAFIDDCRAAQDAAEAAAASVTGAEETCAQSAASAADSANAAHEDADRAEEAAAHVDLPVKRGEGYNSLVVGNTEVNTATYTNCFSCGDGTATTASNAFAGGKDSTATASEGFAFGNDAHSGHSRSTVFGQGTYSSRANQLVFGRYNEYENTENCVEIVGYGMGLGRRANIRTLDTSGNETLSGKLTLGALPTGDMDAVPLSMLFTPLVHDDTMPSSATAFRKSVFSVNPEWAICVGLYAKNVNNDWYQMTPELFTVAPFIHKRDLRFTLASAGATAYGGQPFKAVIFYKLPAASLLSQEVQG